MKLIRKNYGHFSVEYQVITGKRVRQLKHRPGVVTTKDSSGQLTTKIFTSTLLPTISS